MAAHTITLTSNEETLYQKYLLYFGKTELQIMDGLKGTLAAQVIQSINEAGRSKFEGLSIADKVAFLQ